MFCSSFFCHFCCKALEDFAKIGSRCVFFFSKFDLSFFKAFFPFSFPPHVLLVGNYWSRDLMLKNCEFLTEIHWNFLIEAQKSSFLYLSSSTRNSCKMHIFKDLDIKRVSKRLFARIIFHDFFLRQNWSNYGKIVLEEYFKRNNMGKI